MEEVKQSLGHEAKNLVVEGNPGIGKSRFYVYCAFRLIRGLVDDEMKAHKYTLVLNFGKNYLTYLWREKAFMRITEGEAQNLSLCTSVLRLVEASSDTLVGWNGVSILFTSPALAQLKDYKKGTNCKSFISPMWELTELRACNAIADEAHRLEDDELESRLATWGGNPRFVFDETPGKVDAMINSAIGSFRAQDVLSYLNMGIPASPSMYSHCIIAMVPTSPDYRIYYDLEFVSKVVADRVIERASDETLKLLVRFALDNEDNGVAASFRGQLYEMFAHRWFTKHGSVGVDEGEKAKQSTRSVMLRALDKSSVAQSDPSPEEDAKEETVASAKNVHAKGPDEKPSSGENTNQGRSSAKSNSGGKRKRVVDAKAEPKSRANRKLQRSTKKADPKDEKATESRAQAEEKKREIIAHLAIQVPERFVIPDNPQSKGFDALKDIGHVDRWTYCRPKSRTYAVDALIMEPTPATGKFAGNCYGLQMTFNKNHGIKASGVQTIVEWATAQNYTFVYVFVVPPSLAPEYEWQKILTVTGAEHKRSGYLKEMHQLVMGVDPYFQYRPDSSRVTKSS